MARGVTFKNLANPGPEIVTYTISETQAVMGVWFDGFGFVITAGTYVRYYIMDHSTTTLKLVEERDLTSEISGLTQMGGIVGLGHNYFVNYAKFHQISTNPPTGTNQVRFAILGNDFSHITDYRNLTVGTGPGVTQFLDITFTGTHYLSNRKKISVGNPDHVVEIIDAEANKKVSSVDVNRDLRGCTFHGSRWISTNTNGSIAQLDLLNPHTEIVGNAGGSLTSARGCCMMGAPVHSEEDHNDVGQLMFGGPTVAIIHNS